MLASELKNLDGKSVLVRSHSDGHNPPVGVRGWIHVVDTGETGGEPKVEIILEFPDMFNEPAHERVIILRQDGVDRLLASEVNGAFQLTIPGPIR